ncbi:MAG TPA: transcriptional regulator TrmB [Micromonosporaceae bacterium]|nr:transcriptional regulator TrmB [Micromonosporaceae bacterium]
MFEALGIDRTEEQIYLRLLRDGPCTISSLAAATGLSRRSIRVAVDKLNDLGLLSPLPQEKVVAIPLEVGVDHLIHKRQHDLERLRHTATKLGAELQARVEHSSDDQVTILTRRNDVSLALHQLYQSAQRELRILVRSPGDGGSMMHEAVAGRGLAYRVVLDVSLEFLSARIGDSAQTRLASEVPANLALADHAKALLPLNQAALIVRPGHLFDALETLFDAVWTSATPLSFGSHDSVDAQDRELLSLLVAGLTDDAAGARLGMSRRTVARRVQRLMQVTGAHSRLQLGWWAREREWLS